MERVTAFGSIEGIGQANGWLPITPDQHGDWVGQRDDSFAEFISLGDKKGDTIATVFANYSNGVKTNRDAWCYGASRLTVAKNMQSMVSFYNEEMQRYKSASKGLTKNQRPAVDTFINADSSKISWGGNLKLDLVRENSFVFDSSCLAHSMYRPFTKQWMYYSRNMNERVYQMSRIFPDGAVDNLVICLTGMGTPKSFSALISNVVPDVQLQANGQCFPLKLFESLDTLSVDSDDSDGAKPQNEMFDDSHVKCLFDKDIDKVSKYVVRDGITDAGLQHFKDAYKVQQISKEDLFYYIYGLLHSEDYKKRYADNLSKELPRIPAVKKFADFQAFSAAGHKLADLHIGYESVQPYPVEIEGGKLLLSSFVDADYRVTQMKFPSKTDKTRVNYNHKITITGIPLEAYDYVVNGKPALEWVMERQAVTTHKDSGIVNDANLWATETMGDATYPLKLFQRVITVSLETMKIVRALPRLDV